MCSTVHLKDLFHLEINKLKEAYPVEYHELLGIEWFQYQAFKTAFNNTLSTNLLNAIKEYPDNKEEIKMISNCCMIPNKSVETIVSGLTVNNYCDLKEGIFQIYHAMNNVWIKTIEIE